MCRTCQKRSTKILWSPGPTKFWNLLSTRSRLRTFFAFLPIKSHQGRSLSENVLLLLAEHSIDVDNCRAQTYDNAWNMSGKYNGLQVCIREKNELAFYVPCTGHSLNLVEERSVDECLSATNFFGILQQLYTFFSASTHRWDILKNEGAIVKKFVDNQMVSKIRCLQCVMQ